MEQFPQSDYFINAFTFGEATEADRWSPRSIFEVVDIQEEDLKPTVRRFLHESKDTAGVEGAIDGLSVAIDAYYQYQDILDVRLDSDTEVFNRHYCYYEGLVYLRESVASWLDGNVLAAVTLLRPFMELAILHLYWYCRSIKEGYERFYSWLNGDRRKPPFRNQLDYVFDNLPTKDCFEQYELDHVKDSVEKFYEWGCIYNHTPKLGESLFHLSGSSGNISLASLSYYPFRAKELLRQVVHLYLLAYPMSLFPVDRFRKFGFGGITGIYMDRTDAIILESAIGDKEFELLRSKVRGSPEVEERMDWFERQADLSEEELEADWLRFSEENGLQIPNAEHWMVRVAAAKSVIRSYLWLFNYVQSPPNVEEVGPIHGQPPENGPR